MFKVNYSLIGNYTKSRWYPNSGTMHSEQYNPDWAPTAYSTSIGNIFKITHALSMATFYTLNLSYYQDQLKRYVFEDPYDSRYAALYGRGAVPGDIFATGGVYGGHLNQKSYTSAVRLDISSQVNFTHLVKAGMEFRYVDMFTDNYTLDVDPGKYGNFIPHILPLTSVNHDSYRRFPIQGSAYLQDKIEINDLIINIGLRYDYFNSQGVIPTNYGDPGNNLVDNPLPYDQAYVKVKAKSQLSPRLGFAFPITDRGVLHASYGQFFQIPQFSSLYQNPDFKVLAGQFVSFIGNANLEPQRSTIYELGLQQQMADNLFMDVTAFYRDFRHLLGTVFYQTISGGTQYGGYYNIDYGGASGVTLSLNLTPVQGGLFSGSLNYTYQVAEGNGSDPQQAFFDRQSGNAAAKSLVPLEWDVRHNLTTTMTLSNQIWGVSVIGTFRTGLPFTAADWTDLPNSDRHMSLYNINLQAFRNFNFGNVKFQIFVRAENIFDSYTEDDLPVIDPRIEKAFNSNNFNYLNSIYDYRNNPGNYPTPRQVKVGFRIEY